jgi:hypothetical protein
MTNQLEPDSQRQTLGSGINFVEIIRISLQNWKIILLGFLLGVTLSSLYYLSLTDRYQAVALISMLKHPNSSGAIIEQPHELIARMKVPTTYDPSLIDPCGLDASTYRERLSAELQFTLPKGTANLVELALASPSQIVAIKCISKVVDMIDGSQFKLFNIKVQDMRDDISRLNRAKAALEKRVLSSDSKFDNSQQMNFISAQLYFEIVKIEREISNIEALVEKAFQVRTTLVEPVYVSNNIKFKGVKLKLFFIMSLGILLGFLGALMMPISNKKLT